jgi:hypothetical protein
VKKFLFLAHGEMRRTPEFQQAHRDWWTSVQDHVVDSGNPLLPGWTVTSDGRAAQLGADDAPALGYSILEAASIEEAIALLAGCPMDMWVYEALPM